MIQLSLCVLFCSWILYEKPHFEGPSIPLEEGELELTNLWGEEQPSDNKEECKSAVPAVIGSIRHVVKASKNLIRLDYCKTELLKAQNMGIHFLARHVVEDLIFQLSYNE